LRWAAANIFLWAWRNDDLTNAKIERRRLSTDTLLSKISEVKGQPTWVDSNLPDLRTLARELRPNHRRGSYASYSRWEATGFAPKDRLFAFERTVNQM
jgi:hypothetical protein